jgi:hypothetical protein
VFTHIAGICTHSLNKKREENESAFHHKTIHKQEMKMQSTPLKSSLKQELKEEILCRIIELTQ